MKKKLLSTLAAVSMLTNLVTPVMAAPISHNENQHYSYATGYEGNVTEAEFLQSSYTIKNSENDNLLDELMAYVDDSLLAHELRHVEWYLENHDSNYPFTLDSNNPGTVHAGFDSGTATLKAVITRTDGKVVTASTTLVAAPRTISYATGYSMDTSLVLRTGSEAIHDEVITIKPTGETGAIFSADQAQAIIDAVEDEDGLDVFLRQGYNISTSDNNAYEIVPTATAKTAVDWNGYSGFEKVEVTYQVGQVNQATGEFTKGYLNLDVTGFAAATDVKVDDGVWVDGKGDDIVIGGVTITAKDRGGWDYYDLLQDIKDCMNAENRYSVSIKEDQPQAANATDANKDGVVLQIVMNSQDAKDYETILENLKYASKTATLNQAQSYQDYTLGNIDDVLDLLTDSGNSAYTIKAGGTTPATTVYNETTALSAILARITTDTEGTSVTYTLWNTEEDAIFVPGTDDIDDLVLRAFHDSTAISYTAKNNTVPSLNSLNGNEIVASYTDAASGDTVKETLTLNASNSKQSYVVASDWYLSGADTDGTASVPGNLRSYTEVTASTAYDYTLSVDGFARYSKNVKTDEIDDVARSIRISSIKAIQPTGLYQTSSITVAVGAMVDLENHFKVNSTTNSSHDIVYNEAFFNNDSSYTYNDYGVITKDDEILGVREGKNKVIASVYNSATNSTYYAEVTVTVVPRTGTSTTVTPTLYPLTLTASASTITLGGAGTSLTVSNYGENNISDSLFPTLQSSSNFKIEDNVVFVSNDPTILSVDAAGVVTAVGVGTGSVTVKVPNSDYEATATVSVIAPTIPNTDSSTGGSTSVPATAVNVLGQLF